MKKIEKQDWEIVDKEGWNVKSHFSMDNYLLRKIIHDCGTTSAVIYELILSHRNICTNQCNPTLSVIAKECNVSERTVERNISLLFKNGFLDINSGTHGTNNDYFFPLENFYKNFNKDIGVRS